MVIMTGIVLVGVGVLYIFFSRTGETEPTRVASNDGKAILSIPEDTLPAGVEIADIKITKLPGDDPSDFLVAYRLEPDGLQLKKPVKAEIRFPQQGTVVPQVFYFESDGRYSILGADVAIDAESAEDTKVSVNLEHFSFLAILAGGAFEVEIQTPKDHYVGESFYVPASVKKLTDRRTITGTLLATLAAFTADIIYYDWDLMGNFYTLAFALYPLSVEDTPPLTRMEGNRYDTGATFTCERTGEAGIKFFTVIDYRYKITQSIGPVPIFWNPLEYTSADELPTFVTVFTKPFKCLPADEKPAAAIDAGGKPIPEEGKKEEPEPEEERKGQPILTLVLDGQYFPEYQFRKAEADVCPSSHWHANGQVFGFKSKNSLEIVSRFDPNPGSCGFGEVGDIPNHTIWITEEQSLEILKHVVR